MIPFIVGLCLVGIGAFLGYLSKNFWPVDIFEFCMNIDCEYNLAGYDS